MGYVDAADDTNTIETDDVMDKVHLNDSSKVPLRTASQVYVFCSQSIFCQGKLEGSKMNVKSIICEPLQQKL